VKCSICGNELQSRYHKWLCITQDPNCKAAFLAGYDSAFGSAKFPNGPLPAVWVRGYLAGMSIRIKEDNSLISALMNCHTGDNMTH
jgi:hypothetical protein